MHYVEMTRKEEQDREDRFDMLVDNEVQKQYARRDLKMAKEKEARNSLLQNVMQSRKEQIRNRGTYLKLSGICQQGYIYQQPHWCRAPSYF